MENSVDVDQVLRYFVVHNFVVNGDSYTGSMVHNYYLYEQDGLLSMIPWDYNLAFGGFQSSSASDTVNDPIDTPLSVTGDGTRPMADWIFQSEAYTALYHQYFAEFLETVDVTGLIDSADALIAPYVERDPTKFCTYEEFEVGVSTLREFCRLRAESVAGQLDGSIPSTADGQRADSAALVDASGITISDMGSMNSTMGGFGGHGGEGQGGRPQGAGQAPGIAGAAPAEGGDTPQRPSGASEFRPGNAPDGGENAETETTVQTLAPPAADSGGRSPRREHMGQGGPAPEGLAGGDQPSAQSGRSTLLLLGASALCLLLGLAAAFGYRRGGRRGSL